MDRQPPIDPDFVSPKAEKDRRAAENSSEYPCDHHRPSSNSLYIESENWTWDDQSGWKVAGKKWQEFNRLWYGNVSRRLDDPSVSLDARNIGARGQTIIVLPSYVTMFDHVWAQAFRRRNPGHGVIITGQPGTGVSLLSLPHFQNS